MRIGLLKETKVGEHRVAITHTGVAELLRDKHEIFVEKDEKLILMNNVNAYIL